MQKRQMSMPSKFWKSMMAFERYDMCCRTSPPPGSRKCLRTGVGTTHSRCTLETTRMITESCILAASPPCSASCCWTLRSMNCAILHMGSERASHRCALSLASGLFERFLRFERCVLLSGSDSEPSSVSSVVSPPETEPDSAELRGEASSAAPRDDEEEDEASAQRSTPTPEEDGPAVEDEADDTEELAALAAIVPGAGTAS
mmetsp:Transcript_87051/g.246930  ORF Transcript_87051/g.246930 Transcript_87051/m.246930 type:complete len:202 (-) Transcript_87051:593-1198(-)